MFTSDITWSVTADELSLLMKATLCVCRQRRGSNVIWVPKQNSSHVLVPSEGEKVNKASIHRRCHCSQKGETVHTGFHAIYHTVISHSLWSLWSFLLLSCLHPSDSWPSLSLSLSVQERVSNITTGYHWYGARHWDDQTLWTRQQICQQHQQAAGCSRGERGETEKKEIILHRFYLYFIPV